MSSPMSTEDAFETVIALARENIVTEEQAVDDQLMEIREEQIEACNIVEDFFVNNITEGRVGGGK